MGKLKLIISGIVIAMMAVGWRQHLFNESLRRDNQSLRGAITELKQPLGVRQLVVDDESLRSQQLDELSKLRSEMARLRGQTNQIGTLLEANQRLAASLKDVKTSKEKRPEDALPQDIHPNNAWMFRGYKSPDETLESMVWAQANGDKSRYLAAMAPELRAEWEKQFSEAALADSGILEFRVLDRQIQSDDLVVLTISIAQKAQAGKIIHSTQNAFFKRIDGEWKVADSAVRPR
jgi:hypothetical protein